MIRDSFQERVHQHHVDHGRFIDHEEIAVERTFFVFAEASRLGVDLKKPMDRLGLVSCCLGHPFGRASGRRAQEEANIFRGENAQDGIHQGGLADTRAAGDHHHFRAQRGVDCRLLAGGKHETRACFHPRDGLLGIDGLPGQRSAQETAQPVGDRALGVIEAAEEDAVASFDLISDHLPGIEFKPQGVEDKRVRDFQKLDRQR